MGKCLTFGGRRARRTIRVCSTVFEKRGPIGVKSSNGPSVSNVRGSIHGSVPSNRSRLSTTMTLSGLL